ncbi:Asp23/Gls24 family envelope stress response protein [Micromonospora sp. LAH09]|uniref:Asp23/Gls24 family envelope stress response protein n=1 Tax=Micromonospora cabrerizensis TaxID=2911213 RepID=UPI001EE8CC56|nr:Asp23/Gls24 family envelope stress response protein [Micromonospora cabrerizensis]MCG5470030.1 Asp23/Gls24 family envelope stress response protein [Micromonospora cabrerizensis]
MSRQQLGTPAGSRLAAGRRQDDPRRARRPRLAGDPTIRRRPRADRAGRHHRVPSRPVALRQTAGTTRVIPTSSPTTPVGAGRYPTSRPRAGIGPERRDPGTVGAADVARIAAEAARRVSGVTSAHPAAVRLGGGSVGLDLHLVTSYGNSVPAVSEAVRVAVCERVAAGTGLTVAAVTITVDDLLVPGVDGAAAGRPARWPEADMRTINRAASVLLAVALLVGGVLLAVQALLVTLGRPASLLARTGWYDALTSTRWHDSEVRAVAGAAVLLGLVILAAQLRRWTPVRLRTDERDGWHLRRRCVERRLTEAAATVPGVRRARVRIRRRGDQWRPRVRATGDPAARAEVEFAVRQELRQLASPRAGRIEIRLLPRRRPA